MRPSGGSEISGTGPCSRATQNNRGGQHGVALFDRERGGEGGGAGRQGDGCKSVQLSCMRLRAVRGRSWQGAWIR